MSLCLFKIMAAVLILMTSLLAGMAPLRRKRAQVESRWLSLGEALGGGIFLGIAFFHMLPDAQVDLVQAYGAVDYPYANLLCMCGFVILFFFEKVILRAAPANAKTLPRNTSISYLLPLVLSLHALTEGMALGINTLVTNVLFIFIAIIVHKGSESFALATQLNRSELPLRRCIVIFFSWALMSPLGILLGATLATQLQNHAALVTTAIFNALAAGTFIYIATLHKTTHACAAGHAAHPYVDFLMLLLGLGLMAMVEIWL